MTRSEIVERMRSHRTLAETCLSNAQNKPGLVPPSYEYKVVMLSESTAHATLAIFYQGELRDDQP